MRKSTRKTSRANPVSMATHDAAPDWRSLVEQIAELEDILTECGAVHDQDADQGRAWLHQRLLDKRRQLRGIDVAVPSAAG